VVLCQADGSIDQVLKGAQVTKTESFVSNNPAVAFYDLILRSSNYETGKDPMLLNFCNFWKIYLDHSVSPMEDVKIFAGRVGADVKVIDVRKKRRKK
jgi:hypothetical protein